MAVEAKWFASALQMCFGGSLAGLTPAFDWLSDTIKVALFTDDYVPDQDLHDSYSSFTDYEVANGNGYITGGITLTTKTLTYNSTGKIIVFDADDVTWDNATIDARYAIIYDDTNPGKYMLGYIDFGESKSCIVEDFSIQWNELGIFHITLY